ncbi:hypothetical protein CBR_g52315 [Chara braunii]|uniref:Transcription initiation factor TFIID subunit 9 n=1 Tax=Chara braunii TaxID=69332 RepID=A0A388K6P4_CHABU|nr:hypothetical protein CBR_g52315 [Chara braunii]|eukprot:GBG65720.1 hypothetical protein CBR_g52315 [Chara braunii]
MGDPAADKSEYLPRDARVVKNVLKAMGVEEYEPRVLNQFLEFMHRYITDVLTDARVYSEHASKSAIDVDDVRLAIQSRVNFSFTQPPPREVLLELAKARNSIPLPIITQSPGIPLPPEQDTLLTPNYQILTVGKPGQQEGKPAPQTVAENDGKESAESQGEGDAVRATGGSTPMEVDDRGPPGNDHEAAEGGGKKVSFMVGKRQKS